MSYFQKNKISSSLWYFKIHIRDGQWVMKWVVEGIEELYTKVTYSRKCRRATGIDTSAGQNMVFHGELSSVPGKQIFNKADSFHFKYLLIIYLHKGNCPYWASWVAQLVKNPPAMQEDSWVRKFPWRRDRLPTPVFLGFPGCSDGKESACSVWDLG